MDPGKQALIVVEFQAPLLYLNLSTVGRHTNFTQLETPVQSAGMVVLPSAPG